MQRARERQRGRERERGAERARVQEREREREMLRKRLVFKSIGPTPFMRLALGPQAINVSIKSVCYSSDC